jgi:hypothetical protein
LRRKDLRIAVSNPSYGRNGDADKYVFAATGMRINMFSPRQYKRQPINLSHRGIVFKQKVPLVFRPDHDAGVTILTIDSN